MQFFLQTLEQISNGKFFVSKTKFSFYMEEKWGKNEVLAYSTISALTAFSRKLALIIHKIAKENDGIC